MAEMTVTAFDCWSFMLSQEEKAALRGKMRALLRTLDPTWANTAGAAICTRLAALAAEFRGSTAMSAWVPFFPGEIDLGSLIDRQLEVRTVLLPVIDGCGEMQLSAVGRDWRAQLAPGPHGIPQPSIPRLVQPAELLLLVPGLAFDRAGRRLGRSGGYYDRLLSRRSELRAVVVGVCWSQQLLAEVPTEAHDMRMDYVCTELELIRSDE